jgi:ubiquinone/menaquinone biosynthesis C-methylase UbiE
MCDVTLMADWSESKNLDSAEEAFTQKLIAMINNGMAGLMISIGHRTGLFNAMRGAHPMTSVELANRAGLIERYVREWLGAMATSGIVELDHKTKLYHLPQTHAGFLGKDAPNGCMSSMFQFLSVLGDVETQVVDCFHNGGGVPYSAYERFHEVMAEESNQTVVAGLDDHILPLVPGLASKLEAGIDVADIGCGLGRAITRLAAQYPKSRFTGFDLCADAILMAELEAADLGLNNICFHAVDATTLESDVAFDLIFTFDAIHDQAHPATVLSHIRRLLKPDGVYLMQDIDAASDVADNMEQPLAPFTYTVSCMHCMTVSLAQGGVGLGAAWGEQLALSMLQDAGFANVQTHRLPHDIQNIYYLCQAV